MPASTPSRLRSWLSAALISASAGLAAFACSGEDSLPNGVSTDVDGGGDGPIGSQPCTPGAQKECGVPIAQQGDVLSCYKGVQACAADGAWGECGDGEVTTMQAPEGFQLPGEGAGPSASTQALSNPVACNTNPCDPYCQNFDEEPDAGLEADGGGPPQYSWPTGSLGDYPPGLVNKGLKEPCKHGEDCQFNHRCTNVETSSACPHSKCDTGSPLPSSCDPCVQDICASQPSCCGASTCAHGVCETGAKLDVNCGDACVQNVCAVRPQCCTTAWTQACVNLVQSQCGQSCCDAGERYYDGRCYHYSSTDREWTSARSRCNNRGSGWGLVTINNAAENNFVRSIITEDVWIGYNDRSNEGNWVWDNGSSSYTNWSSGEPNNSGNEDCAEMHRSDGRWNDADCSGWSQDDEAYVCEGPTNNVSVPTGWDSSCVNAVKSVCDAECGSSESGVCLPWYPGQTDSTCAGWDLAIGVPCGTTIPVCNHGTVAAPAGLPVSTLPANSNQYPKCNPSGVTNTSTTQCTTTQPIPPGECIQVDGCLSGSGIGNQRTIVVNATTHPNHVPGECSCVDNWSLWERNTTCGFPACSGSASQAVLKDVNMFVTLDRSGSMGGTKWTGATTALRTFFQDSGSAGIGVAFESWPLNSSNPGNGCGSSNCGAADCANAYVPLGVLTAANGGADPQETALVNALNAVGPPSGGTPSYPALDGALDFAEARQAANSDEVNVVIFVTDGQPTQCLQGGSGNATNTALANRAGQAFLNDGVRTYTIGMQGANIGALDNIAAQGGTGSAFVISGNASQIAQQLAAALQAIAAENIQCSFTLPNPGQFDPSSADVVFTPSSGPTVTLNGVSGAGACSNNSQWYYDNPANPTEITLCPATCTRVQNDPNARVSIEIGCPAGLAPTVVTEEYEATCPQGSNPQWGLMTWDSVTPSDSNIQFRGRTAVDQASLAGASYITLGTAQAAPDTQVCPLSGGPASCPVDVYDAFGLPEATNPWLELEVTINPSSNNSVGPTLNDWQITYSCVPNE